MQEVMRDKLIAKAKELLLNGAVTRVFGWKRGEFCYDITPALFTSAEQLDTEFYFGDFAGANLSKYLIAETRKEDGKVAVFMKPCDTYSFNQLLTEHRIDRNKVYVIGVACEGMLDNKKLAAAADAIKNVDVDFENVNIETLWDGTVIVPRESVLAERCLNCKSKKHVALDELVGYEDEITECNRFDEVARLEAMTPEERFEFWQGDLSRCIRCNACRDVCPACTCEKCVFDNPNSGVESKAPSDSFEEKMFHIIRAFHVTGRCTDCGECSRVCPQGIPLHLLNRKFIKDINELWGEYQAGAEVGSRAPLVNYTEGDMEPSEAVERGDKNA